MQSSGYYAMWLLSELTLALVRTDVSEARITSIIRVTRIGELGTMLAGTINRSTLRINTAYHPRRQHFSLNSEFSLLEFAHFFVYTVDSIDKKGNLEILYTQMIIFSEL
jgi:hypothetical protein